MITVVGGADTLLQRIYERGWKVSHAWTNRDGTLTMQFEDPNKYPPEVRATWPEDRFRHGRRRDDPVETGRGWHNVTGPTIEEVLRTALEMASGA